MAKRGPNASSQKFISAREQERREQQRQTERARAASRTEEMAGRQGGGAGATGAANAAGETPGPTGSGQAQEQDRPLRLSDIAGLHAAISDVNSRITAMQAQNSIRDEGTAKDIQVLNDAVVAIKEEVKQMKERMDAQAPAATSRGNPPPAPQATFVHDNRLQMLVPEDQLLGLHASIRETMQQERQGAVVNFDCIPRPPKRHQAAQAGAGGRPLLRLVDVSMMPSSRRAIATLGGSLRRKYGIIVKDALTREGVAVRQQRGAVYGVLRAEAMKQNGKIKGVRWEQGVEVSYFNANGNRVTYNFARSPQEQLPEEVAAAVAAVGAATAAPGATPAGAQAAAAGGDANMA